MLPRRKGCMGMYGVCRATGVHRDGQHPYTSPHLCDMAGTRPPAAPGRRRSSSLLLSDVPGRFRGHKRRGQGLCKCTNLDQ